MKSEEKNSASAPLVRALKAGFPLVFTVNNHSASSAALGLTMAGTVALVGAANDYNYDIERRVI
jgi:hypothetical protein